MESSPGLGPAVQPSTPVPNNQVQEIIALKVMKQQMDSQRNLVAQLMEQSLQFNSGTYTRSGQPSGNLPGANIDVTL